MIPAPIVSLQLPVDDLTLGDFQASLYVLFHELIVHAYQRLGTVDRVTDREDPFAEGWMDFIAQRIYMYATAGALELLGNPGRSALSPVRRRWIANCAPGLAVAVFGGDGKIQLKTFAIVQRLTKAEYCCEGFSCERQ